MGKKSSVEKPRGRVLSVKRLRGQVPKGKKPSVQRLRIQEVE